jgi:cob(I)alamin adenosyltransferase
MQRMDTSHGGAFTSGQVKPVPSATTRLEIDALASITDAWADSSSSYWQAVNDTGAAALKLCRGVVRRDDILCRPLEKLA